VLGLGAWSVELGFRGWVPAGREARYEKSLTDFATNGPGLTGAVVRIGAVLLRQAAGRDC